jgi:hypothetical protein
MKAIERGHRVKITELGPKDSYNRAGLDEYHLIGMTGELIEIFITPATTSGFISCRIKLDVPLLNYMETITLVDAKIERIPNGQGKHSCESTKIGES